MMTSMYEDILQSKHEDCMIITSTVLSRRYAPPFET